MKITLIGPGIMEIPPKGWGAVEILIWDTKNALEELNRLEKISLNRNPSMWMNDDQLGVLRICSLNCAGLQAHFEDIKADERIQKADVLLLQETSLNVDNNDNFELTSHPIQFHVRDGRGKGVSVYMKQRYAGKTMYKEEGFQIAGFSMEELAILNIYRSSTSSKEAFCDKLLEVIDSTRVQMIFGDFNVCGQREKMSRIPRFLSNLGFTQLVHEATQIQVRCCFLT